MAWGMRRRMVDDMCCADHESFEKLLRYPPKKGNEDEELKGDDEDGDDTETVRQSIEEDKELFPLNPPKAKEEQTSIVEKKQVVEQKTIVEAPSFVKYKRREFLSCQHRKWVLVWRI